MADIDLFSGSTMTKRKHGARLTDRMVRKDKRPAPSLGATFELLSPFIDLGLSKGSRITADRLNATAWAKQVFQKIAKLLGRAEAERIFLDLATPLPKAEREDLNNCLLLDVYISSGGWPIDKLARHLVKVNEGLSAEARFGTRGSRPINEAKIKKLLKDGVMLKPEAGIAKQLRRLLGKGPPKNASPALRMLIEEARQLPRSSRGPKRKQNGSE